ncbi:unnamed protein product, partial [Amoebophrya sp. A25]
TKTKASNNSKNADEGEESKLVLHPNGVTSGDLLSLITGLLLNGAKSSSSSTTTTAKNEKNNYDAQGPVPVDVDHSTAP